MKKRNFATVFSLFVLVANIFVSTSTVFATETDEAEATSSINNTASNLKSNSDKILNQVTNSGTSEDTKIYSNSNENEEVNTDSSTSGESNSNPEKPVTESEVASKVRITYNANGGSNLGALTNDEIILNGSYPVRQIGSDPKTEVNFTAPDPTKQIFDGWNTKPGGDGDSYTAGQEVDSWPYSEDTILYAQWAPATSVTFNLNGTTGKIPDQLFNKVGNQVTIPLVPTDLTTTQPNTSVDTTKWNTQADGNGVDFIPGSQYTLTDSNLILYVVVKADPIESHPILSFIMPNGEDKTGNNDLKNGMGTSSSEGYKIVLPSTLPTSTQTIPVHGVDKSAYRFAGWKINGKVYAAGDSVEIKYSTAAEATWIPLQYINYLNGLPNGSKDVVNQPVDNVVDADGKNYTFGNHENPPTRVGTDGTTYKFLGWRIDNSKNVIDAGGTWKTNTQPATWDMLALWESHNPATQYTVSLNSNGGTGDLPFEYTYVNKGSSISIPSQGKLVKSGFTFVGWSDGTTTYDSGQLYTPTKDVTLIAQWSSDKTEGTIKFVTQSKSGSNPSAMTDKTGTSIKLPNIPSDNTAPEKDYIFWGWATNKNSSVPDYYAGNNYTLPAGVNTLYGIWTGSLSEYWTQIKVNVNNADGALPDGITSNNFYPLDTAASTRDFTVPNITRTGYKLTGWTYKGQTYQPNDIITLKNIATTRDPGTLTAQWEAIKFNVSYDRGDADVGKGSVPTEEITVVDFGDAYTLLKNTGNLSRDGFTFVGWTDGNSVYTPGQKMIPEKNIVLKPAWKKILVAEEHLRKIA